MLPLCAIRVLLAPMRCHSWREPSNRQGLLRSLDGRLSQRAENAYVRLFGSGGDLGIHPGDDLIQGAVSPDRFTHQVAEYGDRRCGDHPAKWEIEEEPLQQQQPRQWPERDASSRSVHH